MPETTTGHNSCFWKQFTKTKKVTIIRRFTTNASTVFFTMFMAVNLIFSVKLEALSSKLLLLITVGDAKALGTH